MSRTLTWLDPILKRFAGVFMTDQRTSRSSDDSGRLLFVTGRLAESVVRTVVDRINHDTGRAVQEHCPQETDAAAATDRETGLPSSRIDPHGVAVVGISVAALMDVEFLKRKLTIDHEYDRVILPGWCQGDLTQLESQFGIPFERGPKEILDLPQFLGQADSHAVDLSWYDIEIIAEINHAPRLPTSEVLQLAASYRASGADVIDVGCVPGESWSGIGEVVQELTRSGYRVSVDSFDRTEIEAAVTAGAELVLSCNSQNVGWLSGLGAEVVVIPDDPRHLETLEETITQLDAAGTRYRIDPILEPIGFGFAASLARYYEIRHRYPDAAMLMGIGNLTEMTEADSVGMNVLLAAICQELEIQSILTTEVANWCRTAVRELDAARRMVKYAVGEDRLPKHVDSSLVMLRDSQVRELGAQTLTELASQLRDPNYRIFVERGEIHMMNRNGYWRGTDANELFSQLTAHRDLEPSHAFYLGYELSKAVTALTLGKQYFQDQALQWGILTVPEASARMRRRGSRSEEESS